MGVYQMSSKKAFEKFADETGLVLDMATDGEYAKVRTRESLRAWDASREQMRRECLEALPQYKYVYSVYINDGDELATHLYKRIEKEKK
jgi:hypothetical protein